MTCGDEFPIVPGDGYLIYMKKSGMFPCDDSIVVPVISITEGLNILSFPGIPSGYTSYDLLLYLESPKEIAGIQRFNTEKGSYETTNYSFGRPSGDKFNIVNREAYLIHMKVDKSKDAP